MSGNRFGMNKGCLKNSLLRDGIEDWNGRLGKLLSLGATQCSIASLLARGTGLVDSSAHVLLHEPPVRSPNKHTKNLRRRLFHSVPFTCPCSLITARQPFGLSDLTLQLSASPSTGEFRNASRDADIELAESYPSFHPWTIRQQNESCVVVLVDAHIYAGKALAVFLNHNRANSLTRSKCLILTDSVTSFSDYSRSRRGLSSRGIFVSLRHRRRLGFRVAAYEPQNSPVISTGRLHYSCCVLLAVRPCRSSSARVPRGTLYHPGDPELGTNSG